MKEPPPRATRRRLQPECPYAAWPASGDDPNPGEKGDGPE
jgi:hypothetical protein